MWAPRERPEAEVTDVPRPPGYPLEFERSVRLSDGRRVLIRPIVPADAPELAEAIRSADPETLRRRFIGAAPRPTRELLHRLTTVDYVRRFALVARDAETGRGVAVARYEGQAGGTADVAVAVHPAWRRVGLATALVHLLAQAAVARGIHTFAAEHLADNQPVAALLADAEGAGATLIRRGITEFQVALDQGLITP
jgi:RimJ/RimL family protein N-acetyltransferase